MVHHTQRKEELVCNRNTIAKLIILGGLGFESKKSKREETAEAAKKIPDVMYKYNARFINFQKSTQTLGGNAAVDKPKDDESSESEGEDWTKANPNAPVRKVRFHVSIDCD